MKNLALLLLILVCSFSVFGQQNAGSAAHNFTQVSLTGENVELGQLKGKVVVMAFWSTRCMICSSEIPKLNKIVDKYAGKNVVFLAPTMNNEQMINKYLKKKSFKFNILPNSLGVILKYADRDSQDRLLMGYPAYFVVDKNGKVVLKENGYSKTKKLDSVIAKHL